MSRNMKDSGVEWIGAIPEHWEVVKIKNLAGYKGGLFLDGDWIESDIITSEGVRYLTTGNIGEGYFKEQGDGFISEETLKKMNCLIVYPGDLVISRLNKPIGRACLLPDTHDKYVIAVDNVVLRPNPKLYNRLFLKFAMNIDGYSEEANMISRGATMPRISRTLLGNIKLPIPSSDEQQKIANFLDKKVAEIDHILDKTRESIEEYKMFKQSIITEAVTKGLDPNVPMKDSGIEWIGEIPEGWSVASLKKYVNIKNGREINLEMEDVGDAIPVYGSGGIFKFTDDILFKGPSVLFGRKGTIGRPLYVEGDFWTVDTMYYTSFQNNCVAKFCYYMLQSFPWDTIATKTALPSVAGVNVANSKFAFPALTTQKSIVDFLDEKVALIDSTISKKEILLIELEAYKKSLIYEVVTGKKEVI